MTISYTLGPNPKWYLADEYGKPLAGGYLAVYSSLNPDEVNPIYMDNGGLNPWPLVNIPNTDKLGIQFDANGMQGPFYWYFDSTHPDELYYLFSYDSDGVPQWSLNNYIPEGGGGGSVVTNYVDLKNLIVNNVFWHNVGSSTASPVPSFVKLSPGAHSGFAQTVSNAGPDICFIKSSASTATDTLSFPTFDLGDLLGTDVSPVDYLLYECNNTPANESEKYIQFPIIKGIQNLTSQTVSGTIWAKGSSSGVDTISIKALQFTGDPSGSASPSITTTLLNSTVLSDNWEQYTFSGSLGNVAGLTLGGCGNDGLFIQIWLPLNASCEISLTKPTLFLGNQVVDNTFQTYDDIDAVINSTRTGYVVSNYETVALPGFVRMDDGSIGSPTSGATTRQNKDTFPLYNLLWNNVGVTWAPMSDGSPYGSSAIADFVANRAIKITRSLGRSLAAAGAGADLTARTLGQYLGSEDAIVVSHTHTHSWSGGHLPEYISGSGAVPINGGVTALHTSDFTIDSTGSSGTGANMQPSSFMNFFIKL